MTKKRTSQARHVADLGSLEHEGMKLFVKLWCGLEDNMEHTETACTAVDWNRVAGLSSCKHSNDFNVHGSAHPKYNLIYIQQDATLHI